MSLQSDEPAKALEQKARLMNSALATLMSDYVREGNKESAAKVLAVVQEMTPEMAARLYDALVPEQGAS